MFMIEPVNIMMTFLYNFFIFCDDYLPVCMYVCHQSAWCPLWPENSIGSPGTGITDNCEPPRGC